jgi:hypothetical protein
MKLRWINERQALRDTIEEGFHDHFGLNLAFGQTTGGRVWLNAPRPGFWQRRADDLNSVNPRSPSSSRLVKPYSA